MKTVKSRLWLAGLSLMIAFSDGYAARGQAPRRPAMRRYQSSVSEPYVSPYLNLARPGADPGFNYYTLVQPQLQQQRSTQIQSSQIQGLSRDIQQGKAGAYGPMNTIRPTGRGATYRNYSHFYPGLGAGGGAPARNYPNPVGGATSGFGVW